LAPICRREKKNSPGKIGHPRIPCKLPFIHDKAKLCGNPELTLPAPLSEPVRRKIA
jgi:hypothetical protein